MHCFLFPVHGPPPNDIDVKRLPSTSSSSSPVGHLVDLYLSCNPVGQSGRTFFFSSTEIPPGPTLTSSKRPPTIAIHQFRPRRSREVTYREFGNCKVSFGFLSAKIRAYKSYLRKSRWGWAEWTLHLLVSIMPTRRAGNVPVVDEYVKHAQEGN